MAAVALLFCTAVVLALLWTEQRASRGVSPVVWIPTIWMMIISSRPLGIWFGSKHLAGGNEAGSELDRWALVAMAVVLAIVLVRRRFDWWGNLGRQKWLLVLFAYMLVSTFWSDITAIAFRRWVREIIVVVIAFSLMSEANPRQAFESVMRRCAYILLPYSVVLIKYYPALGRSYGKFSGIEMWTGVTGQKNLLGRLCMISILFLLSSLYQRWQERPRTRWGRAVAWADISVIIVGVYLLIGSHSSTSLATLLLGGGILGGLLQFRRLKLTVPQPALLASVVFLMAFGTATPFAGGADVADLTGLLGRDQTLTGRTEVWADAIAAWKQRPVVGYGFGSFWTDARRKTYDIPTAHNGFLDILLEQGGLGLVLCTLWLLSCARQLRRALRHDYVPSALAIVLLLVGLVYNVTESAINSFGEQMTAVVAIASMILPYSAISRSAQSWSADRSIRNTERRWHQSTSTSNWGKAWEHQILSPRCEADIIERQSGTSDDRK